MNRHFALDDLAFFTLSSGTLMTLLFVDARNNNHLKLWKSSDNFAGLSFVLAGQYYYIVIQLS